MSATGVIRLASTLCFTLNYSLVSALLYDRDRCPSAHASTLSQNEVRTQTEISNSRYEDPNSEVHTLKTESSHYSRGRKTLTKISAVHSPWLHWEADLSSRTYYACFCVYYSCYLTFR